jgi:hypothetical protein
MTGDRDRLAAALHGWMTRAHSGHEEWECCAPIDALLPVIRELRAEAAAEALETAADELDATSQVLWDEYKGGDPSGPHRASTYTEGTVSGFDAAEQRLRVRAAALRTDTDRSKP